MQQEFVDRQGLATKVSRVLVNHYPGNPCFPHPTARHSRYVYVSATQRSLPRLQKAAPPNTIAIFDSLSIIMKPLTESLLVLLSSSTLAAAAFREMPSTFAKTRCSDSSKLGSPTYGSKGVVFTTCSEREIHAPIQTIYDALLDFSEYYNWNTFVIDVVVRPGGTPPPPGPREVGFGMTFTTKGILSPGLNSTSDERVTFAERDVLGDGKVAILGWKYEGFGPEAEHTNVLVDLGGGCTRYVSWESYYGPSASIVQSYEKNLAAGFQRQADDLKGLVEG